MLVVGSFFSLFVYIVFKIVFLVFPLLLGVAFLTLLERKILGSMQRRKGPNVVGPLGIFQPLADGLKLLSKEAIFPNVSNRWLFFISPVLILFLSLFSWSVVPFAEGLILVDLDLSILLLFALSSLAVYGIILAGWSSNSRYAFLGSLRSAAQMISYEVSFGLILMVPLVCCGSLSFVDLVYFQRHVWFFFPFFPLFIMFLITALAETNRPPFDLPEAEAELVSGYNVEYSSAGFALFFIGEYANIILMSFLTSLLFFGGWFFPYLPVDSSVSFLVLVFKSVLVVFFFVWVRATYPRYRYDQLMDLGWKSFLPLSLGWVIFIPSFFISLDTFLS